MNYRLMGVLGGLIAGALLGCAEPDSPQDPDASSAVEATPAPEAESTESCNKADGLEFLCGPVNAEDLVWLGDTGMLIASGMADADGTGRLYAIDSATRRFVELYSPGVVTNDWDQEQFPDCPGVPNPPQFSTHGLAIQRDGDGYRLYATGHGAREAVEVFAIRPTSGWPEATWIGCVTIPDGNSINSVVGLPDGGFLTTRISGMGDEDTQKIFAGEITGFLYEWHPGGELQQVAGTDMSGPNGIDLSPDGESVYVASWGASEITRFSRAAGGELAREETIEAGFRVDNIRFTAEGMLLAAGHRLADSQDCGQPLCFDEWEVAELDPASGTLTTLAIEPPLAGFLGATVAVRGGQGLWLGTFHGDRVIFIPDE